jgi:hypothetical protein
MEEAAISTWDGIVQCPGDRCSISQRKTDVVIVVFVCSGVKCAELFLDSL